MPPLLALLLDQVPAVLLGEQGPDVGHVGFDAIGRQFGREQRARLVEAALEARKRVLLAVTAVPALTLGLYLVLGSPGFPDQPYAKRLEGWRNQELQTLTAPQIGAVLRDVLKSRRDDPEGYRMLAIVELESGNMPGANRAIRRAVAIAPDRADLRHMLGEALVMQAGGKVDADAEAVFAELLRRDPKDASARFY